MAVTSRPLAHAPSEVETVGRNARQARGAGLVRVGRVRALVRYFRDPSASIFGKLFVLLAVVYVICPIDLVPDVPLVGWLDDLGVASLAMGWLGRVTAGYRDPG